MIIDYHAKVTFIIFHVYYPQLLQDTIATNTWDELQGKGSL